MTIDLQPTLTGKILTLRPLRAADFDALFAVSSDPLIWEQHPAWDRYKEDVFKAFFKEAMDTGGALVALEQSTGRVIGSSRYYGYTPDIGEIEIGWSFLARDHWGGHSNREMKTLMLDHIFQYVAQVVFLVGPENWRSRRAMEKVGGIFMGERENATHERSVVYQINRSDWMDIAILNQEDD